jgi:hypothetical protein
MSPVLMTALVSTSTETPEALSAVKPPADAAGAALGTVSVGGHA